MISDRERALLDLLRDPTPLCPYNLKQLKIPVQGQYGPNTCGGNCVDEPECLTGGPWPIDEFPDLLFEVGAIEAELQVNQGNLPEDHPLWAWWENETNKERDDG